MCCPTLYYQQIFRFLFFFPVPNIDTDMLAIFFLLVAIEDLCHGIHIFQAQNGGFYDPIILLSHVVKIFHSMQSVCGHYSILVLLFNIISHSNYHNCHCHFTVVIR